MPADQWWFARDGEAVGPVSYSELKRLSSVNELTPASLVWSGGMVQWLPAGEATSLFDAAVASAEAQHVAPQHAADQEDAKASGLLGLLAKPASERDAKQAVGAGAAAGYAFAVMQLLGVLFVFLTGTNVVTHENYGGDPGPLIGSLALALLVAGLAAWFHRKPRPAIPILLFIWFLAELAAKFAYGFVPNAGWLVFYTSIAAGFIAGIRGSLFLRPRRSVARPSRKVAATVEPAMAQGRLPNNAGSFVSRHWRGELSLPVSYWVVGICSNVLIAIIAAVFTSQLSERDLSPGAVGAAIIAFLVVIFSIATWQLVGVWRSAGVHYRTKSRFWGAVARIAVVLGLVQIASQLHILGPMAIESTRLALGLDDTPPYALRLLRQGTEVELSGGMPSGTAAALKTMLDAAPQIRVVHLNSIGGFLGEGDKIRKLIAERGVATYTSSECVSACTIAFLGGTSRYLSPHARLGFHSARFGSVDGSTDAEFNSSMIDLLRGVGASDAFVRKAFSTPSADMWYPTREELLAAKIVTEVVDANQFALSATGSIDRDTARTTLERASLEFPLLASLKRHEPAVHERLLETMARGVSEGRAVVDIQRDIATSITNEMLPKYLRHGASTQLRAYWLTQIEEMRHFQRTDPTQCAAFLFPERRPPGWDMSRILPADLIKRDLLALTALIEAGPDKAGAAPPAAISDEDWGSLFAATERSLPNASEVVSNPDTHKNDARTLCNAFLAFYGSVLSLPPQKADAVLRYLASAQ